MDLLLVPIIFAIYLLHQLIDRVIEYRFINSARAFLSVPKCSSCNAEKTELT